MAQCSPSASGAHSHNGECSHSESDSHHSIGSSPATGASSTKGESFSRPIAAESAEFKSMLNNYIAQLAIQSRQDDEKHHQDKQIKQAHHDDEQPSNSMNDGSEQKVCHNSQTLDSTSPASEFTQLYDAAMTPHLQSRIQIVLQNASLTNQQRIDCISMLLLQAQQQSLSAKPTSQQPNARTKSQQSRQAQQQQQQAQSSPLNSLVAASVMPASTVPNVSPQFSTQQQQQHDAYQVEALQFAASNSINNQQQIDSHAGSDPMQLQLNSSFDTTPLHMSQQAQQQNQRQHQISAPSSPFQPLV